MNRLHRRRVAGEISHDEFHRRRAAELERSRRLEGWFLRLGALGIMGGALAAALLSLGLWPW